MVLVPVVLKLGSISIFFFVDECVPREPVHVHVCRGKPSSNSIKIWLTKDKNFVVDKVKRNVLSKSELGAVIEYLDEEKHQIIIDKWLSIFGDISFRY